MANRPALDDDGRDGLRRLVEAGHSLSEAGSLLGVSSKTVYKAAREMSLCPAARPRPVYTDEQRRAAVELCRSGLSSGEVARRLGTSDTWVQAQAREAGLSLRRKSVLVGSAAAMVERYANGESSGAIARDLGVSDVAVLNHLRANGVPLRQRGWAARQYDLDESVFDTVTPTSAYWAGFLRADCCVSDEGRITLGLHSDDVDHVRSWLVFLGSPNRPIELVKTAARAQVGSRRIATALADHGIVPRKSHLDVRSSEELAAHPAFWRGLADGDGTISYAKGKHGPVVGIVGTPALMEQYADFLAEQVLDGFRPRVLTVPKSNAIRHVKVEGRRARTVAGALWAGVDLDPYESPAERAVPALERKVPRVRAAVEWMTRTEREGGAPGR